MPTPKRDEKCLDALQIFLRRPQRIEDIQTKFGISQRTAYRWIDYLLEKGCDIVARRINKKVRYVRLETK